MSDIVFIMAGGTAGHIFPGIAIAKEFAKRGKKIYWIATKEGMENELLTKYPYKIYKINSIAIRGKGLFNFIKAIPILCISFLQIIFIFIKNRPDAVIGMGGYASGVGAIAAKFLFINLAIHEQNKIAGTTNKILAKLNIKVFQAFDDTFAKKVNAITVGNPLITKLEAKAAPKSIKKILIIGGSLGAKKINEVMAKINIDADIWHQTGKDNFSYTKNLYKDRLNEYGNKIKLEEFIDNMANAYKWADLVICRSGAITVTELIASKSIAILVPYPHAIANHQLYNAKHITDKKAGILLEDKDLSVSEITKVILSFNLQKLENMHHLLSKLENNNSTKKIADYVLMPKR